MSVPVKRFFGLGSLLYLQFILVYPTANWVNSRRESRYSLHFDWELALPFIPEFIYIYLSLSLFIILPIWFLQKPQLRPWAVSYMWMTFLAGALFILMPTEYALPRPTEMMESSAAFKLLYTLDLPHNLFPSLHVAYTSLALLIVLGSGRRDLWVIIICCWWLLLQISVIFVRQHYLLDIVGGLVLALACYTVIFKSGQIIKVRQEHVG